MDTVPSIIEKSPRPGFSFEVLPPLRGRGIEGLFENVERLMPYEPFYINVTTHRSEIVYKSTADGLYQKVTERSRPGTVAVAAALQNRFKIPAVPHLICSGYTKVETEYALIDLNFLGINNLLLLRGDKAKHEPSFIPNEGGNAHASDLIQQVNHFNDGYLLDGAPMDIHTGVHFSYGVAGYPEKHEESPNAAMDLAMLKAKVDAGAEYIVTQMFFDNRHYFEFVDKCRGIGINVPVIPGLKPIVGLRQMTLLPRVFKVDLPQEVATELMKCRDDNEAKAVGVEWCIAQSRDLIAHGVKSIHYYSHNAVRSVEKVVKAVF